MKSSCFPPKNAINQQTSNSVSQSGIRGLVFGGKQLEFMFCLGSQKDIPLTSLYYTWVICHLVLLKSLLDIYFFSLGGARTILCLFISYFPHFLLGFLKWDFPVLKSFPETRRWERQNQSLILSQTQPPSLFSYTHKKVAKNQSENTNRKSYISYYCFAL